MKTIATLILSAIGFAAMAQTTITNAGFENWGNTVPAGDTHTEPTSWYSNQSGSSTAMLGGETCFQDATVFHTGLYSVRVETISGPLSTVINGNVTTGVVNAPTFTKTDGYIGTENFSDSTTDQRRMVFTGRPDSLVGWYQYTQSTSSGGTAEQGKVRAILHTGQYYDPETPATYHPDPTPNKIADALFLTPTSNVTTWTRFSVPFTYVSSSSPAYIMINVTSSANQGTTVTGSTLWLDDLDVIYPTSSCAAVTGLLASAITATSATISWSAATGSGGYVYAVNTSAAAPSSGTYTTGVTASITGLTSGSAYYAHVKDTCSAGNASDWVTIPFSTTGISNLTAGSFGIMAFPNPVKDELMLKITGAAGATGQVQVMDMAGRLISTAVTNGSTLNMSMNGLPSGIYFIRYIDAAHTQTIKINKQ